MRTKIRLTLDFGIQLLLILLLLIQVWVSPGHVFGSLGVFALLISIWQIGHAMYVVEQYQDWYRSLYLRRIKRVVKIGLLVLMFALLVVAFSLGLLTQQVLFGLQYLGLLLAVVVAVLAFQYFGRSIIILYHYLIKPKSFWDL